MKLLSKEELLRLKELDPSLYEVVLSKLQDETTAREVPPYVKGLFLPQQKFFSDPSKKKAAVCSRRAGKSEALAAWLLEGGRDDPGGLSVYVAISRNLCRLIMWRALTSIERRFKIGLQFKEEDNQLLAVMPNGHRIWMAGCKDSAEIDKFRGPFYRRVAIDEAQSYGAYIKELVEDVFEPALMDLNGDLVLTGTPGPVPAGYFYNVTTGCGDGVKNVKQWSTHHWTLISNPHLQIKKLSEDEHAREIELANYPGYQNQRSVIYLDEKLEENGWEPSHPSFRREWLGEWVRDAEALVYPYDPKKNECYAKDRPRFEDDRWHYFMGVDVGFNDPCAFVVAAMRQGHPEIYIIYAEKKDKMIPSAMAAHVDRLSRRFDVKQVVIDSGGAGKGYAEETSDRYEVHMVAAEKTKKRAFVEIVYGEMVSGQIKIDPRECGELIQEMNNLVWDESRLKWEEKFDDHLIDAFTYVVRSILTTYRPRFVPTKRNHREEMDHLVAEHKKQALRFTPKQKRRQLRELKSKIASGRSIW